MYSPNSWRIELSRSTDSGFSTITLITATLVSIDITSQMKNAAPDPVRQRKSSPWKLHVEIIYVSTFHAAYRLMSEA
jgi:hypothetical protein